ncbi:Type I restriction modification DNA specificity domain protein [Streptococcus gordonii]|uniref:restriction endonuclease subunit S n=1 Tax=Streptococcus gordonii TaxID=1302 RepID=UPI000FA701DE|nr:restriction endonuclease subunit S [Streptococcus gordonii]RSJ44395.1 Type I restriction modification DNA specificity domain protein [Streptococcus gordonii]
MKERYYKIPKIRFNKYLESWKKQKYEDVIEVNSGKDYKHLTKGDIPVYGTGGYMLSVSEAITNKDGVGIGRKGTINKPYILKAPYWTVDTLFFCIPKNKINLYFINSIFERTQWDRYDESTGVPSLSKLTINNIQNYFPSFDEQSAIGSLFRTLDDLLANYKDNLANYQSLKATMLSKMFPKDGQTVPEIRLDGFEGEWEVQTLKELASFSKGNGYTKNDLINSGKEIILYGRLYTNYQTVISKVNTFVTTVKANTVISKGGEVIVPSSGESAEDISRASVVEKSGIILGGDLNIIYPDRNEVNSIFLALTISNGSQQKELIKRAQGKSVVHLRNNDLEKVVLNYPSIEEQQAISSYFSNFDNLINSHQEKISQLETLKKKLLQDMFI